MSETAALEQAAQTAQGAVGSAGPAHGPAGAQREAGAALWLEVGSVRRMEGGGGTMPC